MQCTAVCCNVLQCVAVCCSVLQCVVVCCNALQNVEHDLSPSSILRGFMYPKHLKSRVTRVPLAVCYHQIV